MTVVTRYLAIVSANLGVWTLLLAVPPAAQATAILFSNFGPGFSYNTAVGNPVGNDFTGLDEWPGDTFTPGTTARLSSIEIALSDATFPSPDPVTVALRTDAGDQPGAVLESFLIPPGTLGALGNNNPDVVLTSLLDPLLSAGIQYWVTAAAPITSSYAWNFNNTGELADHAISVDNGATWFTAASGFYTPGAFEVDGTPVPEPGTLGLLVGGGLMLIRRRWPSGFLKRIQLNPWFG